MLGSNKSYKPNSGNRRNGYELRELLEKKSYKELLNWAVQNRNPLRPLSSLLFDEDSLIRFRAIEVLGKVAAIEYKKDPERVRRQIGRFLWLMNDESGGICWNAPQAIGEILYNVPDLIPEYGPILTSYFDEEPFEVGSRWGVARAALKNSDTFGIKFNIYAKFE